MAEVKDPVEQVADGIAKADIVEDLDEDAGSANKGLHPNDEQAGIDLVLTGTVKESPDAYNSCATWQEMNLPEPIMRAIRDLNFARPSSIQRSALPIILRPERPNLIGQAKPGSGKTAAYVIGMLTACDANLKAPQALCITPTRELTLQVADVIEKFATYTGITVKRAVPNQPKGVCNDQIIVGTPGSVIGKLKYDVRDKKLFKVFVCDEADTMIAPHVGMGHGDETMNIRQQLPQKIQILLFSATFPVSVQKFATKLAVNANRITVRREELTVEKIHQFCMVCADENEKIQEIKRLFVSVRGIGQVIIFCQTIASVKALYNALREDATSSCMLHGKCTPEERDATMRDFRAGTTKVLLTTNVLSRGIDVPAVAMVVNYDLPLNLDRTPNPEVYLHRIGRCGRFGQAGVSINLLTPQGSSINDNKYIAEYYHANITQIEAGDNNEDANGKLIQAALDGFKLR